MFTVIAIGLVISTLVLIQINVGIWRETMLIRALTIDFKEEIIKLRLAIAGDDS